MRFNLSFTRASFDLEICSIEIHCGFHLRVDGICFHFNSNLKRNRENWNVETWLKNILGIFGWDHVRGSSPMQLGFRISFRNRNKSVSRIAHNALSTRWQFESNNNVCSIIYVELTHDLLGISCAIYIVLHFISV